MGEFVVATKASMNIQPTPKMKSNNKITALQPYRKARFNFGALTIQPKLKVSLPDDPYEQEADRVAEKVMTMHASDSIAQTKTRKEKAIDRRCATCKMKGMDEDEKLDIGRTAYNTSAVEASNEIVKEINDIRSSAGYTLDSNTKEFMESRFGCDFGAVRIHSDERAARSAKIVNALAYTVGSDIMFGAGLYQPNTTQGRRLLAHELTHVVQQGGIGNTAIQRDCSDPDFCKPYATTAEADSAEWWIRNTYLRAEGVETFGTEVKGLYERYLSRSPGDSLTPVVFNSDSSYLVSSFKNSGDTTDDMDDVIDLEPIPKLLTSQSQLHDRYGFSLIPRLSHM